MDAVVILAVKFLSFNEKAASKRNWCILDRASKRVTGRCGSHGAPNGKAGKASRHRNTVSIFRSVPHKRYVRSSDLKPADQRAGEDDKCVMLIMKRERTRAEHHVPEDCWGNPEGIIAPPGPPGCMGMAPKECCCCPSCCGVLD